MFDENCCKASDTFYIVKREEEGKLCGTASSFNPFSSCVGPRLKDDIEVKESVIKTTTILEQKLQRSCTGCRVKSFISTFPFTLAAGHNFLPLIAAFHFIFYIAKLSSSWPAQCKSN